MEYYADGRTYWNHVNSIWSRRKDSDVLAFCYENIKKDLPRTVERVADFMDLDLDDELKEVVVRQSDIKFIREHNHKFDDHIVRDTRNVVCNIPMDGTTSKVRNGEVGESKDGVPDEIKAKVDEIWNEEITSRIGLRSYDDLQKELIL